jgi:hypothetical protein
VTSDQARASLNRLAAALHELSYRGTIRIRPEIRLLLVPGTPDADPADLHAIGLSPQIANLLADTIERLMRDTAPTLPAEDAALAAAVADIFNSLDVDALRAAETHRKDVDE